MSKKSIDQVTDFQLDALREHINIGVGMAASTLNQMIDMRIHLDVPKIKLVNATDFLLMSENDLVTSSAIVTMPFFGNVTGSSSVVFTKDSAVRLVEMMVPESAGTSSEVDAVMEATLTEVGNIIINSVMGSLANLCQMTLRFNPPFYQESSIKKSDLFSINSRAGESEQDPAVVLIGEACFSIESRKVIGRILIAFLLSDLQFLLSKWSEDAA